MPAGPGLYLNSDGYVIIDVLEELLKDPTFKNAVRLGHWKEVYGWFILNDHLRGLEAWIPGCPSSDDYWIDIKQDGIDQYHYGKLNMSYPL